MAELGSEPRMNHILDPEVSLLLSHRRAMVAMPAPLLFSSQGLPGATRPPEEGIQVSKEGNRVEPGKAEQVSYKALLQGPAGNIVENTSCSNQHCL